MATEEPWLLMKEVYRDVTLVVGGSRLSYHKAVLSQHSALVRSLLQDTGWCQCCDVVITLDDVSLDDVKYVMDLIYNGAGGTSSQDNGDIKAVVSMLQIETILVEELVAEDGSSVETSGPKEYGFVEQENVLVTTSTSISPSPNVATESPQSKTSEAPKENTVGRRRGRKRKQEDVVTTPKSDLSKTVNNSFTNSESKKPAVTLKDVSKTPANSIKEHLPARDVLLTPTVKKKSAPADVCEITIEDDESAAAPAETEKYLCPYQDCQSGSKNAQSIKVHLALVHYKKTIQAEFPNWKKQKCETCDKIFGQMTAYYLHMANHQQYKYMELAPEQFRASNRDKLLLHSPRKSAVLPSNRVERTKISRVETPPAPSVPARPASASLTPVSKITKTLPLTPRVAVRGNSFVQGVSKISGLTGVTRSNSFTQSNAKFQQVKTPIMKIVPTTQPKVSKTPIMRVTPKPSPAPPGPASFTLVNTSLGRSQQSPVPRRAQTGTRPPGPYSSDVKKHRGS